MRTIYCHSQIVTSKCHNCFNYQNLYNITTILHDFNVKIWQSHQPNNFKLDMSKFKNQKPNKILPVVISRKMTHVTLIIFGILMRKTLCVVVLSRSESRLKPCTCSLQPSASKTEKRESGASWIPSQCIKKLIDSKQMQHWILMSLFVVKNSKSKLTKKNESFCNLYFLTWHSVENHKKMSQFNNKLFEN